MIFDFDTPIDRRNTGSMKWEKYKGKDIIPLWVADMDFRVPPAVIEALHNCVEHGIFGYAVSTEELLEVILAVLQKDYSWNVQPDWVVWLPGLVTGINVSCRSVGEDQDDVLTAVPAYPPFLTAPKYSRRNLITVDLVEDKGRWTFDFDRLERAITPRTSLFILCNPHNPVGRVFTEDELRTLTSICEKHDITICSDEIHCNLILDQDKTHVPTATLNPDIARRTITLMAPSKTFNLPGLGFSFAVIADARLRQRFQKVMVGIVPHVGVMGYAAALTAYRDSAEWHAELIEYLRKNRDIVERTIRDIPGLSMPHVEATYLAWIDTHTTGLKDPAKFFEDAGVGLWDSRDFGGSNAVRLNFACRRALLDKALDRMAEAMARLVRLPPA